ncbi:hypothetical protein PSTG_01638 [Puccinia striiformis f. sp. tritici PST-78]|uniref:Uncharacterized protein n=1 Tax=Puccinia striiformis f. sp. tritici PST-78 TaxID=1165861 RepID=A0A0L0W1P2_9BASI|nr:hypothetical protein PSTG_01638 [Puccinia striiformis f. sp. tritici PST-78]
MRTQVGSSSCNLTINEQEPPEPCSPSPKTHRNSETLKFLLSSLGKYIDLDTTKKKGGNEDNTSSSILDLLPKVVPSSKWTDTTELALARALVELAQGQQRGSVIHSGKWDTAAQNCQRGSISFGFTGAQCKSKWDLMQIKYKQIIFLMVNYYGEWNDFAHQVILPTPQWAMVLISSENRETDLMKWADMSFPTFLVMYSLDPLVLLRLTKAVNYVQAGYDAQILPEEESSATIQMRALRQVQLDAGVSEVQLLWAMSYLLISSKLATGYLDQPSKDK